jgi:hypothetical protein
MSVPGTGKARPAPAVTERAWAEMPTGRGRWATASLTGTSSGQTGLPRFPATPPGLRPPEPRSFRCVPVPLPVPAGSSVSPLEPLGRTAVNLAAGTGCRMCHRSPAGGDLRHRPGVR